MKRIIKIISLLLICCMLSGCTSGCQNDEKPPKTDNSQIVGSDDKWMDEDDDFDIEPDIDIDFDFDDEDLEDLLFISMSDFFEYNIVFPVQANDEVVDCARLLYRSLETKYELPGIFNDCDASKITTTYMKNQYTEDPTAYYENFYKGHEGERVDYVYDENDDYIGEILIGETNHTASKKAMEILNSQSNNACDFVILAYNSDIAIVGGSVSSLRKGVQYFIEKICSTDDNITLPTNYKCIYRPSVSIEKATIANVDLKEWQIVVPKIKSYISVYNIRQLQQNIEAATGYTVPIVSDDKPKKEYEIIVGSTTRGTAVENLSKNTFDIRQKGNKIFLSGSDDTAISYAGKQLLEKINNAIASSSNELLSKDISASGSVNATNDMYKMTWNEEFNGGTKSYLNNFNASSWAPSGEPINGFDAERSDEEKCLRVENGSLVMQSYLDAENETYINPISLETKNKMTFDYGYMEALIKVPIGGLSFTSFWLCGDMTKQETSHEFDVFEYFGISNYTAPNSFIWWKSQEMEGVENFNWKSYDFRAKEQHKWGQFTSKGENWGDTYHYFGVEVTPQSIKYYYDGELVGITDLFGQTGMYDVSTQFHQIRLSQNIGYTISGTPVTAYDDYRMFVDNIRLYQKDGLGTISTQLHPELN